MYLLCAAWRSRHESVLVSAHLDALMQSGIACARQGQRPCGPPERLNVFLVLTNGLCMAAALDYPTCLFLCLLCCCSVSVLSMLLFCCLFSFVVLYRDSIILFARSLAPYWSIHVCGMCGSIGIDKGKLLHSRRKTRS